MHARVVFVEPEVKLTLEPWRVELIMKAESSHPIAHELGLEPTTITPFSFALSSKLKLESGRVLV